MRTKRRALVLGDETARHPFLRSLPPHVRRPLAQRMRWWEKIPADLRQFLGAYSAGVVAVSTFFA